MNSKRTPAGRPESRTTRQRGRRSSAAAGRGGRGGSARETKPQADAAAAHEDDGRIPLNRYLALNGIASRRAADRLIVEGEVMVDDEIVTELGRRIDPATQRVEVDGVVLKPQGERKRYYLLNKPAGVVCTNDVRENRRRAIDLIADRNKGRIYTVGRLDEETTGLVLLTNDGEFAYRLSHPRYGVPKVYQVIVQGRVDEHQLARLRGGVRLAEFRSSFDEVRIKKRTEHRTTLLVTLSGGRNREIRRVFAKLGLPVRDLCRVRIGDLQDRALRVGYWRPLLRREIEGLLAATEPDAPGERASRGPGRAQATTAGRPRTARRRR